MGIISPFRMVSSLRQRFSTRLLESWVSPDIPPLPAPLRMALQLAVPFYLHGLTRDQRLARQRTRSLPAYVISVGNLVVGGTGKTPFTLWLTSHLTRRGFRVAVLSRGYGRSGGHVALVPASGRSSDLVREYGDEPVLMARKLHPASVWVGKERYRAGLAAICHSRAEVIILDDGFQHRALDRDLDLVLMDARHPFGNGQILPLGPLREPVSHLERASAFVLTRADDPRGAAATRRLLEARFPGKPVFACTHRLTEPVPGPGTEAIPFEKLGLQPAGAFAGIARPDSFFDALRSRGVSLKCQWAFPDHHAYGRRDLETILRGVRRDSLRWLITTEKDHVRLPPWVQNIILAAGVELDFGSDLLPLHDAVTGSLERAFFRSQP